MKLPLANILNDPEQVLQYLAKENVIPIKTPSWSDYPFVLRRREKARRKQIGQHIFGKETMQVILQVIGVKDTHSCKAVRERIKRIRLKMGYS